MYLKGVCRLEQFLTQFEFLSRYALAFLALIILLRCIFSLFRLRPRREIMATLINLADDSEIEIRNWETSIGRSRSCDISHERERPIEVSQFRISISLSSARFISVAIISRRGLSLKREKMHRRSIISARKAKAYRDRNSN